MRAARRAFIVASVPELVKRTRSKLGMRSTEDLGQADLVAAGGVVDDATVQLLPDGLDDGGGGVAEDEGGHGVDEVEAVDTVGVDDMATGGGLDEYRIGLPEDGVTAVAAGEEVAGLFPDGAGLWG